MWLDILNSFIIKKIYNHDNPNSWAYLCFHQITLNFELLHMTKLCLKK